MGTPAESNTIFTSTEQRALELLVGGNLTQEQVAGAIGVDPSYISQLISREDFASTLASRRFEVLQSHNARDNKYDALEDTLLEKLEDNVQLMHRPLEILKSLQVINAAKRRGSGVLDSTTQKQTVINLVLPTQIIQRFSQTNIHNQVIKAGSQELLTIQSANLLSLKESQGVKKGVANEQQCIAGTVASEESSGDFTSLSDGVENQGN